MDSPDLTDAQIEALIGTRHEPTGIEFPPAGLQPYHDWLIRTLYRLAESSAGALRVDRSAVNTTSVGVASGRASIGGVALILPATTLELANHNNATAYLWLRDNAGQAEVAAGNAAAGWPADAHIKLAEVALDGGQITSIVDRRFETVFRV
ncbi:MAG: hypothetical protein AAF333_16930 [Planctomycetota bacterium]